MAEGSIVKKQDRLKPVPPPKPAGCSPVQNTPKVVAGIGTSIRFSTCDHESSHGCGLKNSVAGNGQKFPVSVCSISKENKVLKIQKAQKTCAENSETKKSSEEKNSKTISAKKADLVKPEILPKPQTPVKTKKILTENHKFRNVSSHSNSPFKETVVSLTQKLVSTVDDQRTSTTSELHSNALNIRAPVANFEEFDCLPEDYNSSTPIRPPRSPKNKPFQDSPFQKFSVEKQPLGSQNSSESFSYHTLLKSREDSDIQRQKYFEAKLKSASLGRYFKSSINSTVPFLDSLNGSDVKSPIPPPRRRKKSVTDTPSLSDEKRERFSHVLISCETKTVLPEYATVNYSQKRNRSAKQREESNICSQKITFFENLEEEHGKCSIDYLHDKSTFEMCSDKQAQELDESQSKSNMLRKDCVLETSKIVKNVKLDETVGSFMNPSSDVVSELCSLDNSSDIDNDNASLTVIREDKSDKDPVELRKDSTYQSQNEDLLASSEVRSNELSVSHSVESNLSKRTLSAKLMKEACDNLRSNKAECLSSESSCHDSSNKPGTEMVNVIVSQVEDECLAANKSFLHTSCEVGKVCSEFLEEVCETPMEKPVSNSDDADSSKSSHLAVLKVSGMSALEAGQLNSTFSESSKSASTLSLPCRIAHKGSVKGRKSPRRQSWSSYKDYFHIMQKDFHNRFCSATIWRDDGDLSSGVLADLDSSDNTARQSSLEDVFISSNVHKKLPWWRTCTKSQKDVYGAEESASVSSSNQDIEYSLGPPNVATDLFSQNSKHLTQEYSDECSDLKYGGRERLVSGQHSDSEAVSSCSQEVTHSPAASEQKSTKAFNIAKELMTSERVFVSVLRLLNVDFRNAVADAGRAQQIIPEDEFSRIFDNLPQLQSLNEDLLRDLECRVENWHDKRKIADVIVWKGPFLKLYTNYIQNFEAQCTHFDDCCQKYPKFARVVKEFEALPLCQKLSIKHFMLKPVQRIPQYRLLLDEYFRHLDVSAPDYEDTQTALKIVCEVADHANRSIKLGDHLSKLLQLQSQLKNYEIIKPGRIFLKEGELLKLSRKDSQPRYFILLSDCLLYTSYYGSGLASGLKVNSELPLGGMKVTTPQAEDFRNEFSIISSTRSFTLMARSLEERQEWVDALQSAIKDYTSRQLSFMTQKLNIKSTENSSEAFKLGKEVPVWIQDGRVTKCQSCIAVFTVTFRRHHCRACGKVVCSNCSDFRAPLQYKKFHPDRVCEDCFNTLLTEYANEGKMKHCIETELGISDYEEVTQKYREIKCSFKRLGPHSRRKYRKFVPQRLLEVTANDKGSRMSGWLQKRKKNSWKRYWFVLKDQVLYIYKASEDVAAVETIPMLGYEVEQITEAFEGRDAKLVFQLKHGGQSPLIFSGDTEHSTNRWVSAIREATVLRE